MTASSNRAKLESAAGVVAVAATYVYFLLFAQFGFLGLIQDRLGAAGTVRPVMGAMGLAGLAASLGTAWWLGRARAIRLTRFGFLVCAAAAPAALVCRGAVAFGFVGAWIGLGTAVLTVALASNLRATVGQAHFGVKLGLGTGAAYLFCNLPGVFDATPARQALIAAAAAAVGWVAAGACGERSPAVVGAPSRALGERDFRGVGFAGIALTFLALIWIDSAAFVVIQETARLKGITWGDPGRAFLIATFHVMAAIAAGRLIDRGLFRSLLLGTFALFAAGFLTLGRDGAPFSLAGPIYALGISTYSVALVAYPTLGGDGAGLVPARWRAGIVFGVCGWIGSALGVGMAQDLHAIPVAFVVVAGVAVVGAALLATRRVAVSPPGAKAIVLGFGGAAALLYLLPQLAAPDASTSRSDDASAARGREVYISEGCIHCHSQYVRPRTRDELWWGPRDPTPSDDTPALIGTRRLGPDLSRVGNRRSPQWQRLHLMDPRAISPGSRMPSYAHLFARGSTRGDDLVAYLASLGAEDVGARYEMTQNAPLNSSARPGRAAQGAEVFSRWCSSCHGPDGRGDGSAAADLRRPSMNLRKPSFWLISWGADAEPEQAALERVVRFGISGTSMPGHEYFTDEQVADVAAHVLTLRGSESVD